VPPQFEQAPQPGPNQWQAQVPPLYQQAPQAPAQAPAPAQEPAKKKRMLLIGGLVLVAITALIFREKLTPMIIHPERTTINALMDAAKTNKLALRQLQSLAEQGNAVAESDLGRLYYSGEGVPKDPVEAVKWFRKAADQGYANAQSNLGYMYHNGEGVPKDSAEAVKWWRKAADQGYANAQANLGYMYARGEGVPKDPVEAVKWVRKAADQGYADAQLNLGYMYSQGEGVSKDSAEAVSWYRKAADQGDANAQSNLGIMYHNGEGVPKDSAEAVKWFRKAADQGNATAQKNLASITVFPFAETPKDFEKYLNSLEWGAGKSVKFNHLDSCTTSASYYRCDSGFVVIKDPTGTRTCSLVTAGYNETAYYNTGRCTESHSWW